jgi:hypothetical protein
MAQMSRKGAAPEAPGGFGGLHPMGDATSGLCRLSFNPQLRVEFHGAAVTSDAGLLLPRELDERLGLGALIEQHLTDPRTGRTRQCPLPDLFRQSISPSLTAWPACEVLYPPAGRTPLDAAPVWADPRAQRATHVASDLIESTGHSGPETRSGSIPAGVSLRWGGHRGRAPAPRGQQGRTLNGRHAGLEVARLTQPPPQLIIEGYPPGSRSIRIRVTERIG